MVGTTGNAGNGQASELVRRWAHSTSTAGVRRLRGIIHRVHSGVRDGISNAEVAATPSNVVDPDLALVGGREACVSAVYGCKSGPAAAGAT